MLGRVHFAGGDKAGHHRECEMMNHGVRVPLSSVGSDGLLVAARLYDPHRHLAGADHAPGRRGHAGPGGRATAGAGPYLVARAWLALSPRPNLTLIRRDFFRADLGDAALVCCYLYPGAMRRLAPKLERELRPGALVVSNSFLVPGWEPEATRTSDDQYGTPVYLYRRPSS
jgi:hypothetical protein